MKILVLGAGGIGGMVGGRLAQAGADVTFLVRDKRQQQLRHDGLRIDSPLGDAVLQVATVLQQDLQPAYDLVLVTCKGYDLPSAIEAIRPAMGPATALLPLLNGLTHIDQLNAAFGPARVLGGTMKMQATLTPQGVVRQLNDWQTLTFGEQDGSRSPRAEAFHALLSRTPIEAKLSTNIVGELWFKLVHLATVAGMTCLMRANIGEIVRTPEGSALLNQFFSTNVEIAAFHGHRPDEKFIATYRSLFAQADATYEASMQRDLEKGGPIEGEQILGYMLARCRAAGQPDALHLAAYTHVKAYEERRAAGRLPQRAA